MSTLVSRLHCLPVLPFDGCVSLVHLDKWQVLSDVQIGGNGAQQSRFFVLGHCIVCQPTVMWCIVGPLLKWYARVVL
jgi:hypothetical protein